MVYQERAIECKEKATGDNNKAQCERKDTTLSGQDEPSIAVESILPRENLPLPPGSVLLLLGEDLR